MLLYIIFTSLARDKGNKDREIEVTGQQDRHRERRPGCQRGQDRDNSKLVQERDRMVE